MNAMTFKTFVRNYILDLSENKKFSVSRLFDESNDNKRLVDPLVLYCALDNRELKKSKMDTYKEMISDLKKSGFDFDKYEDKSYVKIQDAYLNYLKTNEYDCVSKTFLRKSILEIQRKLHVSNYRIYHDLKLNPGNTNSFLKNCDIKKLSLKDVKNILNYLKNLENTK